MNTIVYKLLKIVNSIKKKEQKILFIPHMNCRIDHYDILNWESDNVLCVLNYMLNDKRFANYTFSIVYYEDNKLQKYYDYVSKFEDKKVVFVKWKSFNFIVQYFQSKIILTASAHVLHKYKCNNQKLICLGYYTPFKDDFGYIEQFNWNQQVHFFKLSNRIIDYYITTSDLSSRIISCDFLLLYSHLLSLGAPRNDIFYKNKNEIKSILKKNLGYAVDKIITYTPTFRDYESNADQITNRSIFGNVDFSFNEKIEELLTIHNAVLIAKLHPLQEREIIDTNKNSRIIYYSDLTSILDINLYRLLAETDILITDYTSTSFDFMHKKSPIIYYFYDYDKYVETRNFSLTPIFPLCGGDIVYSSDKLLESLNNCLIQKDEYSYDREKVHSLINRYHDGNDTERVVDFIFKNL